MDLIPVEVVYATPEVQHVLPVQVLVGATVREAISISGILNRCPEIDLSALSVGIFSKIVPLASEVQAGDRIEIYRPLMQDPKQKRRLLAKRK